MRTSTVGSWNSTRAAGFTLIELIVVISLISLTLFLAVPRLRNSFTTDPRRLTVQWLQAKVQDAKEKAVEEQLMYFLHVDMDEEHLWLTSEGMTEEDALEARDQGYRLPEGIRIQDVEFPQGEKIDVGVTEICFYTRGYSDKALIHLEIGDEKPLSLLIEPFLKNVKLYEDYAGFDENRFYAS